jgi:hypothetical protein
MVANRALSIKRLFILELAKSPGCDQCKQASGMVSDFEDISVDRILHFVQGMGLLNARAKALHKNR